MSALELVILIVIICFCQVHVLKLEHVEPSVCIQFAIRHYIILYYNSFLQLGLFENPGINVSDVE
jgi:hypothetical protein